MEKSSFPRHHRRPRSRSRRRRKSRWSQLKKQIVDSRAFQIIIGNEALLEKKKQKSSRRRKSGSSFDSQEKSLDSQFNEKAIWLFKFAALPVSTLIKLYRQHLQQSWWFRFSMGVVSGISCLFALFLSLKWLFF